MENVERTTSVTECTDGPQDEHDAMMAYCGQCPYCGQKDNTRAHDAHDTSDDYSERESPAGW